MIIDDMMHCALAEFAASVAASWNLVYRIPDLAINWPLMVILKDLALLSQCLVRLMLRLAVGI